MQAIRQQVLWQSAVLFPEKLDVNEFLRIGALGQSDGMATLEKMSDEQQQKVEVFKGYINRGLPEPDINSPTWREDAEAAFKAHDEAVRKQ